MKKRRTCLAFRRAKQTYDFAGSRVPLELRFLEDRPPITHHLEAPSARGDQLDAGVGELLPDLGRQTGGPRLVASDGAILDRDVHRTGGGRVCRVRAARDRTAAADETY